jgi:hypothetical protein
MQRAGILPMMTPKLRGAMGDPETYRKRAQECAVLAASTASPQHKTVWLDLEQHWLRLAEGIDLYGRVDPFTAFMMAGAAKSSAR